MAMAQDAYELPMKSFDAVPAKVNESHPDLAHLCLLVFEAVLEVVCVSLPGYIVARLGHFDAEKQKFLANLNVMLFTPCLIFTKLASQLSAEKLSDLAIIPAIFVLLTFVSWLSSFLVVKIFRFNRRAANFVTAMGVFGNSNSLPISLVMSLSQTISGLHWRKIPGDNDDEVGARGILYLLIFQQLGQLVRWSWGYHVLLAPKSKYLEYQDEIAEEGQYRDEPASGGQNQQIWGLDGETDREDIESDGSDSQTYSPAGRTPVVSRSRVSLIDPSDDFPAKKHSSDMPQILINGHDDTVSQIHSFPDMENNQNVDTAPLRTDSFPIRLRRRFSNTTQTWKQSVHSRLVQLYDRVPKPVQKFWDLADIAFTKCNKFLWEFMNPPLWAMLVAVLVASIPPLQRLFFEDGSFVRNSVTSAIKSNGDVAVPLILVVLGANLARNTAAKDDAFELDPEEEKIGTKLLIASLISRMLLPTIIMAPILALLAKHLNISILDDPIFVIVCFLLTGAPSALQLAQICQINNVFEKTMGRILFQSYVIWYVSVPLRMTLNALY